MALAEPWYAEWTRPGTRHHLRRKIRGGRSGQGAAFAYGVALLDVLLQPVAEVCATEGRYEFMQVITPLQVVGGTGSTANPLAIF